MTPSELNRRIAERCGICAEPDWQFNGNGMFCVKCKGLDYYSPHHERHPIVPNYCTSRDAMADALATLSREQWADYECALADIVGVGYPILGFSEMRTIALATPLQQARAFCGALGLEERP